MYQYENLARINIIYLHIEKRKEKKAHVPRFSNVFTKYISICLVLYVFISI